MVLMPQFHGCTIQMTPIVCALVTLTMAVRLVFTSSPEVNTYFTLLNSIFHIAIQQEEAAELLLD